MGKTGPARTSHTWRWIRRVPARDEDDWTARLAFLCSSLAVHARPGARTIRIEAYDSSPTRLRRVQRKFGGQVSRVDAARIVAHACAPRRPLLFTRNLAVIDASAKWPSRHPAPEILLRIGGAMAFGTGEHATTASCLRFLRDEAARLAPGWTGLDIGTGTGILAIAAEKFGASRVEAFDNDPRAVRAAEANARLNKCRRVSFTTTDVLAWRPAPPGFQIVTANIYAEILRSAAPGIARAVVPGGCLVVSGILRDLELGTAQAFTGHRFTIEKSSRRGKWVTLQLRRSR